MSGKEQRKLKMGQVLWVGAVFLGNLLVLISIVTSIFGVSVPHPTDSVQNYDCGSVLSPVSSLSDSKLATDIVCKDAMGDRRGSVFGFVVFGFLLSTAGMVMLMRTFMEKKEKTKKVDEKE